MQNLQFRLNECLKRRRKNVTVSTYTVRTGRTTDAFAIDNPVVASGASNAITLTVPDGVAVGQTLLIVCSDGTNNITVTTTTGSDYSLTAAGDYASLQWSGSDSGWVALASQET